MSHPEKWRTDEKQSSAIDRIKKKLEISGMLRGQTREREGTRTEKSI